MISAESRCSASADVTNCATEVLAVENRKTNGREKSFCNVVKLMEPPSAVILESNVIVLKIPFAGPDVRLAVKALTYRRIRFHTIFKFLASDMKI